MFRKMIQTLSVSAALVAALAFPTAALAWWDNWGNWHPNQHRDRGHYDYHPSGHWDQHGDHFDYHDTGHYDYHNGHHDDD